jgi:hypothetical protein
VRHEGQRVHEGDGLEVVGEGVGLLDGDVGAVAGELPAVEAARLATISVALRARGGVVFQSWA